MVVAGKYLIGMLLLCLGFVAGPAVAQSPGPELDRPKGDRCVEDPDFMRVNHMKFLKHYRHEAVHEGIRENKYSLVGCVNCHAGGPENSVTGHPTAFCQGCHEYAAVRTDCFGCHATKPDGNADYHTLSSQGNPLAAALRQAGRTEETQP